MSRRGEAPEGPVAGTGPRVISVAEAAAILRVSQGAVFDWIAQKCLVAGRLPDGALGVRVSDEEHVAGGARGSDVTLFIASSGVVGNDSALVFSEDLVRERRELELAGLYVGKVDVDALSAVLAERLSRVLPAGFTASAAEGLVWIRDTDGAGAGSDIAWAVSDDEISLEARLCRAAEQTLEAAQDTIAEKTTEPWPARAGEFPGGLAGSSAAVDGGLIRLWFGPADAPVLELAPFTIQDVVSVTA